jgi:hypothetical protein
MAKDNGTTNGTDDKKKERDTDNEVPSGFDTRVGRERGDGWLAKSAGQVVTGRLLGRHVMKGQVNDDGTFRTFYQIKIGKESSFLDSSNKIHPGVKAIFQDEDKEKHEVILIEGQILNVDEHKALEELAPYTRDGGVYDVWFKYLSEDKLTRGRRNATFWRLKGPFLKTLRPAKYAPRPAESNRATPEIGEDDIPF